MRIVVLDGYTLNPGDLSWDEFKKYGSLTVYDRTSLDSIIERIGDAEIILTNKTPIDRSILKACCNIRYIGVLATGYNVVDYSAAREANIPVTNIPTYGTNAVGQFAIALLLEICHRIGHHSSEVRKGRWETNEDWCFWDYPLIELAGKTLGIIGFGRIGQATGRIAKAIGMNVIAHDQYESEIGRQLANYVSLDELLSKSDVISLHCPLLPETDRIINAKSIAKMKDGVIIINNSRGQLVDEQALAEALNSEKVYACGIDVVSSEPIKPNNPLLKAKNCIITPHISWASKESRQRLMNVAIDNLKEYINGNCVNVIN